MVVFVFFSDRLTFRKYIKIPLPEDDFDVSFYLEGGNTLYGCVGRIAFKAMQRDGTEMDVTGIVYDILCALIRYACAQYPTRPANNHPLGTQHYDR